MPTTPPGPPEKLEYATPPAAGETDPGGGVGCVGILFLCVGGVFTAGGIRAIVRGLTKPNRFYPSDEFDRTLVAMAIGVVCLAAGLRWVVRWRRSL